MSKFAPRYYCISNRELKVTLCARRTRHSLPGISNRELKVRRLDDLPTVEARLRISNRELKASAIVTYLSVTVRPGISNRELKVSPWADGEFKHPKEASQIEN